jgi:glutaconate CoA-transferase subunit B
MSTLTADVLMPIAIARLLRNGETVFHGVASPVPMVAILVARRLHAPDLIYLNITGSTDPAPAHLPHSTVDPALFEHTRSRVTLTDLFDLSARGMLDTAFLSGVQIDRQANINMSMIPGAGGDVQRPKVRLPGGAGSAAIMPSARRTILWRTKHDPRTFVETVAFRTTGGNVDRVVTPLCVFKRVNGVLEVESIHSFSTPDEVRAQTGWAVTVSDDSPRTPEPSEEEWAALRAVDPDGARMVEF